MSHLSFDDHVHNFDAAQNDAGAVKSPESRHRTGASLDRAMVLFDDVVHVLVLANLDGRFALGVDRLKRGQIGPTFIDRYRLRGAVLIDRFFKNSAGQQRCCARLAAERSAGSYPDLRLSLSRRLSSGPCLPSIGCVKRW